MSSEINSGNGYMLSTNKDAIVTCERLMSGGNDDLIAGIIGNDRYSSFRKELTDTQRERWKSIVDDQNHSGVSLAYMYASLVPLIENVMKGTK